MSEPRELRFVVRRIEWLFFLKFFGLLLGSLCHFKFGALELSVDFGPLLLINFAVELKNLNCSPG